MSDQTSSYDLRPQGPRRRKSALPQFVGPERFAAEILPPLSQSPVEPGETECARIPDRVVQLMPMTGSAPRRADGSLHRPCAMRPNHPRPALDPHYSPSRTVSCQVQTVTNGWQLGGRV